MDDRNKRINFRYRCKIHEVHYEIQLYNLEQEKIKIMINTKNSYSDEYVEYSNIYTLIQFQEITNYYILFQSIEEIFEDLIRTIQEKNFSIAHNGSTMTFKIKVMINKNAKDVNFILDKSKTIDLEKKQRGESRAVSKQWGESRGTPRPYIGANHAACPYNGANHAARRVPTLRRITCRVEATGRITRRVPTTWRITRHAASLQCEGN